MYIRILHTPRWNFAKHNSIKECISFVVATLGKENLGSHDDDCLYSKIDITIYRWEM